MRLFDSFLSTLGFAEAHTEELGSQASFRSKWKVFLFNQTNYLAPIQRTGAARNNRYFARSWRIIYPTKLNIEGALRLAGPATDFGASAAVPVGGPGHVRTSTIPPAYGRSLASLAPGFAGVTTLRMALFEKRYHIGTMSTFLTVLLVLAMLGVLGVLGVGVATMIRGGNPRLSNKMMQLRVVMQGAALLILALLMLLAAGGR